MLRGLTFTAALALLTLGSMAQNIIERDLKKLEVVLKNLDKEYVDSVETQSVVEAGIRAMLQELDPHSLYLDKDEYVAASEPLKGKFRGIGIRYQLIADTLTILETLKDSPAESFGIKSGDRVIKFDQELVSGVHLTHRDVGRKLKFTDKNQHQILIQRGFGKSKEEFMFSIDEDGVEMNSVPTYFMLDDRTGYIKLSRFSATSLTEFRSALDELLDQKMNKLVLDLRGNSGGYLNVAIKIADEFLEDRKLIVYTQGVHQDKRETFATTGGRFTEGGLFVLIDNNSASASEILAGAIQDWDRGLILGRRSYGKGLVQRTIEFNDGSAMRLTISRYYTPTGRSIQRPYEDGVEVYRQEASDRAESGELYSATAMDVNEEFVYYTPLNRKVYGGGGIIPDVFVPLDSSNDGGLINTIEEKGLFFGYAIRYASLHSEEILQAFPTPEVFAENFKWQPQEIQSFGQYCQNHGVPFDVKYREVADIEKNLKVLLGRFAYGFDNSYQIRAAFDPDIQRTLVEIEKGTLNELGLK